MKPQPTRRSLRCAIYTRVSTDQGLEQDFNSLDAQREASEAYVKSQAHEGWKPISEPLRRWRVFRRLDGQACVAEAAVRRRGGKN